MTIETQNKKLKQYLQELPVLDFVKISDHLRELSLYEEAFLVLKNGKFYVQACAVLLNDIKDMSRALQFAQSVDNSQVWRMIGTSHLLSTAVLSTSPQKSSAALPSKPQPAPSNTSRKTQKEKEDESSQMSSEVPEARNSPQKPSESSEALQPQFYVQSDEETPREKPEGAHSPHPRVETDDEETPRPSFKVQFTDDDKQSPQRFNIESTDNDNDDDPNSPDPATGNPQPSFKINFGSDTDDNTTPRRPPQVTSPTSSNEEITLPPSHTKDEGQISNPFGSPSNQNDNPFPPTQAFGSTLLSGPPTNAPFDDNPFSSNYDFLPSSQNNNDNQHIDFSTPSFPQKGASNPFDSSSFSIDNITTERLEELFGRNSDSD